MTLSFEDRLFGCLIGQAVGDALGFPREGRSPDECLAYVEDLRRTRAPLNVFLKDFGQYTDDTQLAREMVISFVHCRGFDPTHYGRRIAAMFTEDRIVGRGRTTEAAALRLARNVSWDVAGTPPPACGNGSAMRAGPVGVLYGHDAAVAAQVAADQGRMTHQDTRAIAGSVAVAMAVVLSSLSRRISAIDFINQLVRRTQPIDSRFGSALAQLPQWLGCEPRTAAIEIRTAGVNAGEGEWRPGIPPYVTSSVLWSLYCFLRSPDDYWEAILTAIGAGGDVDTVAAMTGAIVGARLGSSAIPTELASRINDRGTWRAHDLRQLAREASRVVGA
jgi:ADP-ribosylglycohydrolase